MHRARTVMDKRLGVIAPSGNGEGAVFADQEAPAAMCSKPSLGLAELFCQVFAVV